VSTSSGVDVVIESRPEERGSPDGGAAEEGDAEVKGVADS